MAVEKENEKKPEHSTAIIGGIFVIIAALIGAVATVYSTNNNKQVTPVTAKTEEQPAPIPTPASTTKKEDSKKIESPLSLPFKYETPYVYRNQERELTIELPVSNENAYPITIIAPSRNRTNTSCGETVVDDKDLVYKVPNDNHCTIRSAINENDIKKLIDKGKELKAGEKTKLFYNLKYNTNGEQGNTLKTLNLQFIVVKRDSQQSKSIETIDFPSGIKIE